MGVFSSVGNAIGGVAGATLGQAGGIIGDITGATAQAEAIERSARGQERAAMAGIEETRRQFDLMQELMAPFVGHGTQAAEMEAALSGVLGPEAQQAAIAQIESSPQFRSLVGQGEEALLSQASAGRGLRGGNIQGALAQYRPQMLSGLIQQQLGRFSGIAGRGQTAAAGQGTAGMQVGQDISNLLANAAAARGQGIIAQGGVQRQGFQDLLSGLGTFAAAKKGGVF